MFLKGWKARQAISRQQVLERKSPGLPKSPSWALIPEADLFAVVGLSRLSLLSATIFPSSKLLEYSCAENSSSSIAQAIYCLAALVTMGSTEFENGGLISTRAFVHATLRTSPQSYPLIVEFYQRIFVARPT